MTRLSDTIHALSDHAQTALLRPLRVAILSCVSLAACTGASLMAPDAQPLPDASRQDGGTRDAERSDAASSDGGGIDAGLGDGGPDAGVDPADLFTVRVFDAISLPLRRARVMVGDRAGALVGEFLTDRQGVATFPVEAGGTVTVAVPDIGSGQLVFHAALAVRPGDDMTIGTPRSPFRQQTATATITYAGPVPNAVRYDVSLGCYRNQARDVPGPITVAVPIPRCPDVDRFDVLLTAVDAAGDLIAFAGVQDVRIAAPDDLVVDVGPWRTDTTTIAVEIVDLPPDIFSAGTSVRLASRGYAHRSVVSGRDTPSAGRYELLGRGFDFGDQLEITVSVIESNGFGWEVETRGPRQTTTTFDAATFLPRVTASDFTQTDDRLRVSWSTEGPSPTVDAFLFGAQWADDGETDIPLRWRILIPPDAPGFAVAPELPPDLAPLGRPRFLRIASTVLFDDDDLDYRGVVNGPAFNLRQSPLPPGSPRRIRRSN